MAAWVEATEQIAYGMLGLTPVEYESLQVREFYSILESRRAEEKRQDQKHAYFLSLLISVQCTKAVSPADVLAPLYPEEREKEERRREEQRKADEEYLKREFYLNEAVESWQRASVN